jgi:transcriptional regulator with XRE-family HTH domain
MGTGKKTHTPQELEAFSRRLWEALRRKGLDSKADLARLMGLSDMTVGRWLDGKYMPSMKKMIKLDDKLNVSVEWLQGIEPSGKSCLVFSDDPLSDAISKTLSVLRSQTHYSDILKMNIESFHYAIRKEVEIDELKNLMFAMKDELSQLKSVINFRRQSASITTPKTAKKPQENERADR